MTHGILIIEDEIVLARNIKTYFERSGYAAKTAISAEEGLRQLELFKPKVVIIDYRLPGMDGIQLIAKVRRADPGIKVIMLSGHHSPVLAVNALRVGAVACLAKPLALEQLRRIVDEQLGTERASALHQDRRQSEHDDRTMPR